MILSSLKSGNEEFRLEETSLCDVVRQAASEVASQAAERDVTVEQDIPSAATAVLDGKRIKQVFTIMLDNAIRFSASGGRVAIRVWSEDGDVLSSVTDQGEGIDPDYLPHLFSELTDADLAHHTEGQGLSLAIAQQIVLRHNGTIRAENSKGRGATFTVRLPAAAAESEGETACNAVADVSGQ